MPNKAILRVGKKAIAIANDVTCDSRYRAEVHVMPPDVAAPARRNDTVDVLILVDRGTIEMMIEGATSYLKAGEFARVAASRTYAYRNASGAMAHVLSLAIIDNVPSLPETTVTIHIAAA